MHSEPLVYFLTGSAKSLDIPQSASAEPCMSPCATLPIRCSTPIWLLSSPNVTLTRQFFSLKHLSHVPISAPRGLWRVSAQAPVSLWLGPSVAPHCPHPPLLSTAARCGKRNTRDRNSVDSTLQNCVTVDGKRQRSLQHHSIADILIAFLLSKFCHRFISSKGASSTNTWPSPLKVATDCHANVAFSMASGRFASRRICVALNRRGFAIGIRDRAIKDLSSTRHSAQYRPSGRTNSLHRDRAAVFWC